MSALYWLAAITLLPCLALALFAVWCGINRLDVETIVDADLDRDLWQHGIGCGALPADAFDIERKEGR